MSLLLPELERELAERVAAGAPGSRLRLRLLPGGRRVAELAPLALACAAVIAVVVLALGVGSSHPQRGATASSVDGVRIEASRGVLPPSSLAPGQYFYLRSLIYVPDLIPLPTATGTSLLVLRQRAVGEQWIGRTTRTGTERITPVGPPQFGNRAEERLWRRAGSPSLAALQRQAALNGLSLAQPPSGQALGGPFSITYAQAQALPSDPGAVRAAIASDLAAHVPRVFPRRAVSVFTSSLMQTLLLEPLPAAVHAALLRAIEMSPGAQLTPAVTDGVGRAGAGIRVDGVRILVFDPATGAILGYVAAPGRAADRVAQQSYVASGGVDSPTALPAGVTPAKRYAAPSGGAPAHHLAPCSQSPVTLPVAGPVWVTPAIGCSSTRFTIAVEHPVAHTKYLFEIRGPTGTKCEGNTYFGGGAAALVRSGGASAYRPAPPPYDNGGRGWCPGTFRVTVRALAAPVRGGPAVAPVWTVRFVVR
jgi:hypothetical protein